MRPVHYAYILALAATVLWCTMLVAAPYFVQSGGAWTPVGETIYHGFHRICHQIDDRCVHVFGLPMAACSRCSAIYVAFLAGLILYPFLRRLSSPCLPSRTTLALAIAPMIVDVVLAASGIHESGTLSRLITGTFFGVMLPFVVMPVYLGAVLEHSTSSLPATNHTKGTVDA
jgi:uncharacterized membrane protein